MFTVLMTICMIILFAGMIGKSNKRIEDIKLIKERISNEKDPALKLEMQMQFARTEQMLMSESERTAIITALSGKEPETLMDKINKIVAEEKAKSVV